MIDFLIIVLFSLSNILDIQSTFLFDKNVEVNPVIRLFFKYFGKAGLIIVKILTILIFIIIYKYNYISMELSLIMIVVFMLVSIRNIWKYKYDNRL